MDESWRMRMGMPSFPHRKSMEDTTRRSAATVESLNPEDFSDVFGGPPRSVLSRKFSGEFFTDRSFSFYEEIFRPAAEHVSLAANRGGGRSLPAFRIPAARSERFYGDVFGSSSTEMGDGGKRSRERSRPSSKAKSKSDSTSSVLSSEDVSPFGPVIGDDVALNSFASKLRPINIPCRWNTEQPKRQGMPAFECARPSFVENNYTENDYYQNFKSSYYGSSRRASSPETISLEPSSYRSVKISTDDLEFNSPSSPASSLCQEPPEPAKPGNMLSSNNTILQEQGVEEQEEDEVMSSYVIEINSDYREGTSGEEVSIDEAIAWAKETFQRQSSESQQEAGQSIETDQCDLHERSNSHEFLNQQGDGHGTIHSPKKNLTAEEEKEQSEEQMEMELLDEDIKLWSAGKETNIRLLLSTIHHILWPNSGWYAIASTNLVESSQVKKAYQKARLCLHPDKLQQRGATLPQKCVAEKAFSILQDAWAAFIAQDGFF